jgi:hypothetical protein
MAANAFHFSILNPSMIPTTSHNHNDQKIVQHAMTAILGQFGLRFIKSLRYILVLNLGQSSRDLHRLHALGFAIRGVH